mgnify:FL=1
MTSQLEDAVINKLKIMEKKYKTNLDFFQERVPAIFKLINDDNSQPDFTVDPKTKEVHRMESSSPVYQCNPIEHAQNEVLNFEYSYENLSYPPTAIGITLTHLIKEKPFSKSANHYSEVINTYGRRKLKPAVKDIFIFGIGMGYHIEMLCNRQVYKNITIIDHNIKSLKTSMYCINWKNILTKLPKDCSITIHVQKKPEEKDKFQQELRGHCHRLFPTIGISSIIYNHFPDANQYDEDKKIVNEFAIFIKVSNELIGPDAQRLFNANENIKRGYNALDFDKSSIKGDKIIAIVGAGPSLDIYIDIIKENRDKFFIISAGSALSSLVKMEITPDMHFELEFQKLATTQLSYVNSQHDLSNIELICTYEANPGFPSLFKNAYMFIPESSELALEFSESNTLRSGGISCTNGATAVATRITNKDIYLFGLDFAHTNGEHHSKTNISMDENLPNELEIFHTAMKINRNHMTAKDTKGNIIHTSAALNAARITMESALSKVKSNMYNCSYGAEIKGAEFKSKNDLLEVINNKPKNPTIKFNKILDEIDNKKMHRRTEDIIKTSIHTAHLLSKSVQSFNENPVENCYKIIHYFREIAKNYRGDIGKIRNVFSVSKAPLIQLFVICNYVPKKDQLESVKVWVNEYSEYINFLEDKFNKIITNNEYYIDEDWMH